MQIGRFLPPVGRALALCGCLLLLAPGVVRAADSPPPAAPFIAEVLRGRLVELKDGALTDAPDGALAGRKLFAFYFSAGWCAPCHAFTPKLAAFYREMRARHPEFEVVFVSDDHSEPEMRNYMREFQMPWPALRFEALKNTPRITGYGGNGIPRLVLVNAAGKVLADSFEGENYVGPQRVLVELQKRLATGGGA